MKKLHLVLTAIVACAFGFAAGHWFGGDGDNVAPDVVSVPTPVLNPAESATERENMLLAQLDAAQKRAAELQSRVDRLEHASQDAPAAVVAAGPDNADAEEARGRGRRGRESFEERMERLKTEDPERYAEMQKRREEFEARRAQWQQDRANQEAARTEFFASLDLSALPAGQRGQVAQFISDYQTLQEMREARNSGEGPDANTEEGRASFQAEFELMRSIMQSSESVRTALVEATMRQTGLNSADSREMAAAIQEIYQATSPGGGPFGGMMPPPGGFRRPR